MQRKPIIAGNWKMNCTTPEGVQLVAGLKRDLFEEEKVDVVVCPPFTLLSTIGEMLGDSSIRLGAQDMFWEKKGAFTGEVSGDMLKDIGCQYVIIGHSERRQYFGETNETVHRKVKAALALGLNPIMCVGETKDERVKGVTKAIVEDHVTGGLGDLDGDSVLQCVIAYEPVWAIGTGLTATPEQAEEVHDFIRNTILAKMYGKEIAEKVRIQYGGSVTPDNIKVLMAQEDIDGALVGGASLKVESFTKIVRYYA